MHCSITWSWSSIIKSPLHKLHSASNIVNVFTMNRSTSKLGFRPCACLATFVPPASHQFPLFWRPEALKPPGGAEVGRSRPWTSDHHSENLRSIVPCLMMLSMSFPSMFCYHFNLSKRLLSVVNWVLLVCFVIIFKSFGGWQKERRWMTTSDIYSYHSLLDKDKVRNNTETFQRKTWTTWDWPRDPQSLPCWEWLN